MNFILTLMLTLSSVVAFAPDAQKPYSVIHEYDASFVQSSPASGTYRLRTRVEVKDRKGLDAAVFTAYTDSFRSLTSFSGRIEAAGKTLKKLKMSDIETFSAVNGIASMHSCHIMNHLLRIRLLWNMSMKSHIGKASFHTRSSFRFPIL